MRTKSISFLWVFLFTSLVSGQAFARDQNPDFYLFLSQADVTLRQGQAINDNLDLTFYVNGRTPRPRVSLELIPQRGGQGIMGTFSENPTTRDRITLRLSTTSTTPPGVHQFILRGRGGGLTRTANLTITVPAPATGTAGRTGTGGVTASGGSSGRPGTGGISASGGGSGGRTGTGGIIGTGGRTGTGGSGGSIGSGGRTGTGGAVGTGGIIGTAGRPGTGGITASGGNTGTGGRTGTAGSVGSAGRTGTGGVIGTGGLIGTAGRTGSGGVTASGGSTGTGGRTGTGGSPSVSNETLAFPGAIGFGARATGGRLGDVCIVTNLATSGSGSLQGCLDSATGPRTIVFHVSGVIPGDVQITKHDITIAGQTSPGGIIVRGLHTTEEPFCDQNASCLNSAQKAENIIIRHMRSRGWEDGLRIRAARNVIIDHGSFENAEDENGEFSFSNNITVMNTIFGEGLGDHLFNGTLFNYSEPTVGLQLDRITLAYNNWNRLNERFPELSRESTNAPQTNMDIELINNLLWDQSFSINVWDTTASGDRGADNASNRIYYRLNWIGNYSVARSDFRMGMINMNLGDNNTTTRTRAYFRDNHMSNYSGKSDYDLNYCCNDFSASVSAATMPVWGSTAPLTYPSGVYGNHVPATQILDSRTEVPRHVFQNAGAFPRDALDRRLLNPVCVGTIVNETRNVNRYGDAFSIANDTTRFPTDSDNDGMPNAWETSHGLNPNAADNNGHNLHAGYTNLEMYLNELSDEIVANDTNAQRTDCRF